MKDTAKKGASPTRSNSPDAGQDEVQANMDEETEQGFRGVKVDPTPDLNYSLQTPPDAPTPETDAGAAKKAREVTGRGMTAIEQNAGGK